MNFTFLNIPVRIEPIFWIFLLFFSGLHQDFSIESVIVGFVMFVSLLVHEYGHALTAVYFGGKSKIILEAFGGKAEYNNSGITKAQQAIITLNGPLFESLLIAFPYFFLESGFFAKHYYIEYVLYVTMRVNILWCLLNLIPLDPLDGGHLLRYLLESRFGDRGYRISLIIGMISVILITPYLFFKDLNFFGILLVVLGFKNYTHLQNAKAGSADTSLFNNYMKAIKSDDMREAKKIFQKLVKSNDQYIKHLAIEGLSKIYFQENERQKAYELLLNTNHDSLQECKPLLCKLAFEHNNYELVIKYSRDIYAIDPSYEIAILNSRAFACLNQPVLAEAWLKTASGFGMDNEDEVENLMLNPA